MTETFYPEVLSGGFTRYDGSVQFYQRVNALLAPNMCVVDFGAGRGAAADQPAGYKYNLMNLRGKVAKVVGLDVDPVVLSNPILDEALVIEPGQPLPLADGSADLIVSDFVFEHLSNPAGICRELDRILRPGGWICARTPNRNGYIALGNRLISDRLKDRILGRLQPDRKSHDVFPAHYELNTPKAIEKMFPGYRHIIYSWDSEPGYGASKLTLRLFMLIHSVTPASLKTTLMVFLQKPVRA